MERMAVVGLGGEEEFSYCLRLYGNTHEQCDMAIFNIIQILKRKRKTRHCRQNYLLEKKILRSLTLIRLSPKLLGDRFNLL